MTVAELIAKLQEMPLDAEVQIIAEYDCGCAWAGDQVDRVYMEDGAVILFSEE